MSFWPEPGGWEWWLLPWCRKMVSIQNNQVEEQAPNYVGYRQCVSSWWPLDWFWHLHELYIDIWFTFKSLTGGVCHLFYLHRLMGKGVACGGLPFRGTSCPVPDVANIYLTWMPNVGTTVSIIVQHPKIFPPTEFLFEKRIGLVFMDLLCIRSTYYSQDNQQECFELNLLQCLGTWMNHLPFCWCSNFRRMFINESWCVSLAWLRGIFYGCLLFSIICIHCPNVLLNYSSHMVSLWNSFFPLDDAP